MRYFSVIVILALLSMVSCIKLHYHDPQPDFTVDYNGQTVNFYNSHGDVYYQPNIQTDWPDSNVLTTLFPPNKELRFNAFNSGIGLSVIIHIREYNDINSSRAFKKGTYLVNDSSDFVMMGGKKYYSTFTVEVADHD